MLKKNKKLILAGDSAFAEIAYEYFTFDSEYEVLAFTVEKLYLRMTHLFGIPIIPFEKIEKKYPPSEHYFFAALTYLQLNRVRTRLLFEAKLKGYKPASY